MVYRLMPLVMVGAFEYTFMKKITINVHPVEKTHEHPPLKTIFRYIPVTIIFFFLLIIINGFLFGFSNIIAMSKKSLEKAWQDLEPQSQVVSALQRTEGDASVQVSEQPLSVKRLEWEHLQKVLMQHDGNISAAARALNMHRRTLQRKLDKRPVRE